MQNGIPHKTLKAIFLYDEIASLNIPIYLIFKYTLASVGFRKRETLCYSTCEAPPNSHLHDWRKMEMCL